MSSKIAVVTGGNKGIGYAIVKGLCERFNGIVYLTARNVELGEAAVDNLKQEVKNPKCAALRFHQLDITDQESILRFKRHIEENGGLDILINNAGIAFKHDSTVPAGEQAEVTLKTNYWGTKAVCEQLFPLLRRNGRVVNVSSQSGLLRCIKDEALKNRLESPNLTKEELDSIMEDFVRAAKEGTRRENGYPENNYSMSKVGETALTMIQQRMLDNEGRSDVIVNACCPGYVDTDMTSHKGGITTREGAETPLFLALEEADHLAKGKFFYKKRETNWRTGKQEG